MNRATLDRAGTLAGAVLLGLTAWYLLAHVLAALTGWDVPKSLAVILGASFGALLLIGAILGGIRR